ncbi:MAG: LysE family transporter [Hyphomicrobiaceae bacterium]
MFDETTLAMFAAATLATYLAPGADMAYIASKAVPGGVRHGLLAGLGVLIGIVIQAGAAALGVSALFHASPMLFEIVRWTGVAYLAYLGLLAPRVERTMRRAGRERGRAASPSLRRVSASTCSIRRSRCSSSLSCRSSSTRRAAT